MLGSNGRRDRPRVAQALAFAGAFAAISAPAGAQAVFADGFDSASLWNWSRMPGDVDPRAVCSTGVALVDTSGATVVGNGTPGSCTEAALVTALGSNNGAIRFSCGAAPKTIVVTSEKTISDDLVIDGGGLVTLSGGGTTRILKFQPPFGASPRPVLTLQRLTFTGGSTASLPGTTTANGGGALYKDRFGDLFVLDCLFHDNRGPATGQDVAGGAIYMFGEGSSTIARSRFTANRCSSGGALGALGTSAHSLSVLDSLLDGNLATGSGGNPGNGGNGGGVYMDGNNQTVTLCGTTISANTANARGAGLFRVSNNGVGPMTIDRTSVLRNRSPAGASSQAGGLYLQGLQLTVTASTIAGNEASSTGGMFVWTNPGTQTISMTNSTVAENLAHTGLGSGMSIASGITGALRHVTLARNHNDGSASFASAVAGGAAVTMPSALVADNSKVFIWENTSCNSTHTGTATFQWPQQNAGGQSELACASGTTFLDAGISTLAWRGGPTPTIAPSHPALDGAATSGCPATDQTGAPRGATCTPGAVELP